MARGAQDLKIFHAHLEVMRLFYKVMLEEAWYNDADFRKRFATLFHEAISRIMARRTLSMRSRAKEVESILNEFSYIIPEVAAVYKLMARFVKLTRWMPAWLAFKVAGLVTR